MKLPVLGELKKPNKRQVLHFIKYMLIVVVGNMIAAAATSFFIIPNDLVMGGTTGIGIFVRKFWDNEFAVSIIVYIANIALFILGAIMLGKKFALATLAGTLLYPTFVTAFTALNGIYVAANGGNAIASEDKLLAVICGALLFGLGIGIVVRVGASTGGTDIPPLILHKFFGFPVSAGLWILDMCIVLMQLAVNDLTTVLYGVLVTLLASLVIDMVSPIGMRKEQVKIISPKYKEIREMILNKLNRGVTTLYGQTGFLKQKCFVLMTIVSRRDLVKLKNEIQRIDPNAFLTISTVSEVRGRGFSVDRIVLPRSEEKEDLEEVSVENTPSNEV